MPRRAPTLPQTIIDLSAWDYFVFPVFPNGPQQEPGLGDYLRRVAPGPLSSDDLCVVSELIQEYLEQRFQELHRIPFRRRKTKVSGQPSAGFLDRLNHIRRLLRDLSTTFESPRMLIRLSGT